jgi:GDP-L-fucose synthase
MIKREKEMLQMENNSKLNIQHSTLQKSSKIFVAGGTGLVGSAIIKNLLDRGYTNIVANYHTRIPDNSKLNIQNSSLHTNAVNYVKLDLLDSTATEAFFKSEAPEFVFLAAAKVGGIVANNTYRAEFIYENLQIQNNIIHQSYLNGVQKLLFLGSTCIYPKDAPQPMPESCLLSGPLEYTNEPYAIAKIAGIKMCESYNLQYGTNYISVMPTNLYGPNDNFDLEKSHVLPALIRKIHIGKLLESGNIETVRKDMLGTRAVIGDSSLVISEESSEEELFKILEHYGVKSTNHQSPVTNHPQISIEIWGTGKPMREFLWSEDMADACVYLMENRDFDDVIRNSLSVNRQEQNSPIESRITNHESRPASDGKTCEAVTDQFKIQNSKLNIEIRNTHVNIGTGIDISIHDLAHTIKKIVGFQGELYFNADKPDGTMKKLTDVSKLHSLGWKHSVELEDGIEKMYQWYSANV